ncbi:MAG TPA: TMEM175 family protein [Candidatus Rubrimentiphilum sp.]|nr:TMEM175 family protein [Candidatus Rubrimentiphilum sp.]
MKQTEAYLDKSRLDMLVDAVYAIALTLLVLDLRMPGSMPLSDLPQHLLGMLPQIGVYAIAFSTVALLWVCHHYYAALVKGTDFGHVMLNLAPLMLVALIPFTASVMAGYPQSSWAVAVFTLNAALICFLYVLNWQHCRKKLVPASIDRELLDRMSTTAWLSLAGEAVATALAFVLPLLGIAIAAILVPAGFIAMARLEPEITRRTI